MDIEALKAHIKPLMKPERYEHSIGVMELSKKLAGIYGVDTHKACVAAILHDCAKEFDDETMHKYLARVEIDDIVKKSRKLWHGPVGAVYARDMFGIDDEIFDAIFYHTVGKEDMSLLTQIIFLADVVEINRDSEFSWAKDIRTLAEKDLDAATIKVIEKTLVSLVERGYTVHTAAVLFRNKILFGK